MTPSVEHPGRRFTASVAAAVVFCFSSQTSVLARQDIPDATFKIGMVPDLKGLMREDAISVLVQHTVKPELSGDLDAPDARVDVQAPKTWRSGQLNRCRPLGAKKTSPEGTKPAMSNPTELAD
jgi:hypothetical protein